jgi:hypothetical protein
MTAPIFKVGDQVRVKRGVEDPEFPSIRLGGWSGLIEEVERAREQFSYLIEWNQRTMASLPPPYLERCERLGFDHESVWLGEEEIETQGGEYH